MGADDVVELVVGEREPSSVKQHDRAVGVQRRGIAPLAVGGLFGSETLLQEDVRPAMRCTARTDLEHAVARANGLDTVGKEHGTGVPRAGGGPAGPGGR